jgi:hypothetical protein
MTGQGSFYFREPRLGLSADDFEHSVQATSKNDTDHTLLDIEVIGEKSQTSRPLLTVVLHDYARA